MKNIVMFESDPPELVCDYQDRHVGQKRWKDADRAANVEAA
jgi:hypothetical protein